MKPRQTLKNFHQGSSAQPQPPHQPIHHGSAAHLLQQTPPGPSIRDLDLTKLGINLEDLAILQGNNSNQDELIKCLQALYNKNSSSQTNHQLSDTLQKLPPNNDWPMQSVSPPDFPRVVGGGGGSGGGVGGASSGGGGACSSANSVLASCNVSATDGGASGAASFSNFIDNGNSNQQRQDIQFANAQQQQHPASAMAINHHRFRVNTTNTLSPQDQLSQQQKSVLSLHQHHQNDSGNRRMNHNLSATNTSFANFNAASTISSSANPDTNSGLSSLAGVGGKNTSYNNNNNNNNNNINSSTNNLPPHVSNIMDNIGSPMDNMFYDNSLQQQQQQHQQQAPMNKDTSSNQSLTKHQQLQRLLKATGNHFRTTSQGGGASTALSTSSSSTSNYSHRNDSQRFINNNMSQIQRQLTSPSSAIPAAQQPATLPAVPKSLLNLAACSSSTAASSNNASSSLSSSTSSGLKKSINNNNNNNNNNNQLSNMLNSRQQEVMRQAANLIHNNPNISYTSNNRSMARTTPSTSIIGNTLNCAANMKPGPNGIDAANLLQQMARHAAPGSNHSANNLPGLQARSSLRQQLQQSLLSEDQSSSSRNNLRQSGQPGANTLTQQNKAFFQQQNMIHQRQQNLQQTGDDLSLAGGVGGAGGDQPIATREAFLSSLQERAARAGVSIGEINKPLQSSLSNSNVVHQQPSIALNRPNQQHHNNPQVHQHQPLQQQQQQQPQPQYQQDTLSVTSNQLKDNHNQQGEESFDRKEIESALSRVEARNDLSLLYPPVLLASSSQKQINALSAGIQSAEESELFTKEVRKIVLEECNIIYECKGCNNLFRSLANLVRHKRTYCIENSSANIESMNRRANNMSNVTPTTESATIQNNNTIETTNLANYDRMITTPNNNTTSTATTTNTASARNPYTGSSDSTQQANQKYNLRGRRPDFQALNDSRALRIIQRKGQMKDKSHTSGGGGGCQVNNPDRSGMSSPVAQTSLSKLLQSQPKNRLPVNRDSALMGALNNISSGTSTSISSRSSANNNLQIFTNTDRNLSVNELNEHMVRNSSLAKTLLNENAKSGSDAAGTSSFLDVSKGSPSDGRGPGMQVANATRQASVIQGGRRVMKRKGFSLEACIQKVKRDKIRNEDEDITMATGSLNEPAVNDLRQQQQQQHNQLSLAASSSQMTDQPLDDSRLIKDPLAVDDSDADSDMLMIDLDAPNTSSSHRSLLSKRSTRRNSITTASSTASSSSSTMKLNSSSALLKALTRPVDNSGKPFNTSNSSPLATTDTKSSPIFRAEQQQSSNRKIIQHLDEDQRVQKEEPDEHSSQQVGDITDEPMNSIEVCELQEQIPVPSPLFDKYTCDICAEDLVDHETLMNHTLDKHTQEKMVYPCIFCSLSFITIENACRHIIDFHKKPKTQVRRLREVIKSRSHMTNDFLACSDHPPTQDRREEHPYRVAASTQPDENIEASVEQQAAGDYAQPLIDNASNTIPSSLASSSSSPPPNAESELSEASIMSQAGSSQSFQDEDQLEVEEEDNDDMGEGDQQEEENSQDSQIGAFKSDSDLQKFMPDNFDELNAGFEHENAEGELHEQPEHIEEDESEQQVAAYGRGQAHEPPHSGKSIRMSRRTSSRAVSEDAVGDRSEANSEENDDDDDDDDQEDNEDDGQEEDEEEDDDDDDDNNAEEEDDDDDDNNTADRDDAQAEQDLVEDENQDEDEEGDEEEDDEGEGRLDIDNSEDASSAGAKCSDDGKSSSQATHTTTPTSSSSGGGSGGIMKLKIQLKTRPDEKSKVYRIV